MNLTYPMAAFRAGGWIRPEIGVSAILITASMMGPLVHPLFVISAIAVHGAWDAAKHFGKGVPFFRWYTVGCMLIDVPYALLLLLAWLGAQ